MHFEDPSPHKLLQQADGYDVALLFIGPQSKVGGMTPSESGLKNIDTMILSVDNDRQMIPVPKADTVIQSGACLICYGKPDRLKQII